MCLLTDKYIAGGNSPEGQTCLYHHLRWSIALFDFITFQVNKSVERGKTMQNFSFGGGHCPYVLHAVTYLITESTVNEWGAASDTRSNCVPTKSIGSFPDGSHFSTSTFQ